MGDSLVLRWSTAADVDAICTLYRFVFRDKADGPFNERVAAWARELMSGTHPLITANDFAVVEDTRHGGIVAATCLLAQNLEYDDIPFTMGRPEIVATLPDYRNRGLIRAIFELIHARSEVRGHLVQGITGISYYYRQFGYEYALDLGGERITPFALIPKAKEGETDPYSLREATADDLLLVLSLYEQERSRATISTDIGEAFWNHQINRRDPLLGEGWRAFLILDREERPVGYVLPGRVRWGETLGVFGMSVEQGISFAAVMPSVLRGLQSVAVETEPSKPDAPPAANLHFMFGRSHPAYELLGDTFAPRYTPPYAWYIRVPDLPAFILHIAPVLERRLADSPMAGHTGELKIDFYRGGLRLAFEGGRLATAEHWRRPVWEGGAKAGFPPLVFLQLLFGHRSLADLRYAFPDVWTGDEDSRVLLEALFPPQLAWVMALD
jgi:GNAT superfamily N-acetyltransferase